MSFYKEYNVIFTNVLVQMEHTVLDISWGFFLPGIREKVKYSVIFPDACIKWNETPTDNYITPYITTSLRVGLKTKPKSHLAVR